MARTSSSLWARSRRRIATVTAGILITSGVSLVVWVAPAAATTPGSPGTTQAGTPVYTEDFSNQSAATSAISVLNYTGSTGTSYTPGPGGSGANGLAYTADTAWTPAAGNCNGWIMTSTTTVPTTAQDANCTRQTAWPDLQQMATDLGLSQGQTATQAASNQVLADYTNSANGTQAAGIQLATKTNTVPAVAGHYYAISAYYGEKNCPTGDAKLRFSLIVNGTANVLASNLDPCTATGGTTYPDGTIVNKLQSPAFQVAATGTTTLGLQIYNATATGSGNDVAFDLPQIVDVTPQLDKAFTPAAISTNGTSTMKFTVTNTTDLQAKGGFTFTDSLPTGLKVAATPNYSSTCNTASQTGATSGSTSVKFTGTLTAGTASCTFQVDVTAAAAGSYTNSASNISASSGVNPPGSATLTVSDVAPTITISKVSNGATGSFNFSGTNGYTPQTIATTTAGTAKAAATETLAATNTQTVITEAATTGFALTGITCTGLGSGTATNNLTAGTVTLSAAALVSGATIACTFTNTSASYTITKTATPSSLLAGQTVTYSVAVTNTGTIAYTAGFPASFADDFSGVTDDATYDNDAASNVPGWTFAGPNPLTASGPLAVGATATITYSATVNKPDNGNQSLINSVTATGQGGSCTANGCSVTTTVNAPLVCATGQVYATDLTHLLSTNTTTGASTILATWPSGITNANALAVTVGGAAAYVINQAAGGTKGTVPTVSRYDAGTKAVTTYPGTAIVNTMTDGPLRGGINPVNGIFYFGAAESSDNSKQDIYAFDTTTNTAIGFIGTVSGFTGTNGDIVFDSNGNMLMVVAPSGGPGQLIRISNVPTTAGTAALTGSLLTTLPAGIVENGIAFDGNGYLYVSTQSGTLLKLNPNTGAQVGGAITFSGNSSSVTDLANCVINGSVSLQKNIVGRADPSDQFALSVTGGGVTSGNTGTTSGSSTGQQTAASATAGPVIGIIGTTYTLTETAASGSLANYTTSISCVDTANGNAPIATTAVTTTSYTLVFPSPATSTTPLAFVMCTMTNTPLPRISLSKALGGNRVNAGDQFQVALRTGSASGPAVTVPGTTTTTGTGSTVTAGTGTTGTYTAAAGTKYFLTEAATSGSLSNYVSTITCTDANSVQTGLPNGAAFSGSLAITPVTGANISCLLTNSPNPTTLTIVKTVGSSPMVVGTATSYTLTVTNTGLATTSAATVSDTIPSGLTIGTPPTGCTVAGQTVTCTIASGLALNASTSFVIPVTPTTAAGTSVSNTATVTGGGDTSCPAATTHCSSTIVTPITPAPAVTLVKTATVSPAADQANVKLGDVVTYSFKITNTGNVTLTTLTVNDPSDSGSAVACAPPVGGLIVGANVTCSGTTTHTITQADVDAGSRSDTASATGTEAGGSTSAPFTSTATVSSTPAPAVSLVKTATVAPVADQSNVKVGDVVTYSFKVTNSGNTTLSSVALTDPSDSVSAVACSLGAGLTPGASITCSGTTSHTITQADVDAGSRSDTASVTGTDAGGHITSAATSTAIVTATATPKVTLVKTATVAPAADQLNVKVGDVVTYSFKVTNSGNTTIASVALTDASDSASPVACSVGAGLAPGASITCSGTTSHTITQADVDAGSRSDTASLTGTDAGGHMTAAATSTATVSASAAPAVTLLKTATVAPVADQVNVKVGDVVTYSFRVTNSGNTTIASVVLTDPSDSASPVACSVGAGLAPGASITCTGTTSHTITQADVDAGSRSDTASVTGTDSGGHTTAAATSTATVSAVAAPAVTLAKTATVAPVADQANVKVGDVVTYSFKVTNSGNTTITSLNLTDPSDSASPITCVGGLAPGATVTCSGTTTHTITQADVDAGSRSDTASVTGTDSGGHITAAATSTATVSAVAAPAVTLVKTATVAPVADQANVKVGDVVTYSFKVTNSGNTTITSLNLTDPSDSASPITCVGGLAPGATVTCSGTTTHTITQADVDAGSRSDTASVTGTDSRRSHDGGRHFDGDRLGCRCSRRYVGEDGHRGSGRGPGEREGRGCRHVFVQGDELG